jgi:aminocarboxymuconate-semialdehyde decarboxylase
LAVIELRRAILELGFRGAQIGTAVEGIPLDDARFEPFFTETSKLRAPLTLHTYAVGKRERLEDFQLNNLVGNFFDTGLAAARLVFSGFLDCYPGLKLVLSHGGGYLPYQIGRLDLGFQVRFGKNLNSHPPSEYMKRFFYDTILFDGQALKFLRDPVGAKRLLTGTDLPFNMADVDFRQRINALEIPQSEKELIFYQNAQELFHIAH